MLKTGMKTVLFLSALFLVACQNLKPEIPARETGILQNEFGVPQYTEVQTGGVKLIQVDGKYNVWTKKFGDAEIKVLLLHGGPGFGHEYMEVFESFLPPAGIEMYEYAQLGNFNSDQPDDPNLWTVDRYREEVEQVRKGLGLNNFYIVGHSWGGMLAMEYATKYQQHLKGLVISNMTASIPSYVKHLNELRSRFPAGIIAKMEKYEKAGDYQAPEYQEIMMNVLYAEHICRTKPWPDPLQRTFKHFNAQIYNTMQGPNEFVVTGNFKDWSVWDRLNTIQVPTLVIGAKHDTMSIEDKKRMDLLIPNSRLLICEGSHLSMYDDQQNYFNGLIKFLKEVHSENFNKASS
jgi:proline iminopeptidase